MRKVIRQNGTDVLCILTSERMLAHAFACVCMVKNDEKNSKMIFSSLRMRLLVEIHNTNVTSFCKQFEKVRLGLLQEAFWREGD